MLKKIVLLLTLAIFAQSFVFGQETGVFSYGVKGGLVSSTFASEMQKLEDVESRTAFSLGLFAEYQLTEQFSVSLDALYVQEGTMRLDPRYVYARTSLSKQFIYPTAQEYYYLYKVNSNIVMHNFEFPIMVNYHLPEMNGLQPKLELGASIDYIYRVYARNLMAISTYDYWGDLSTLGESPTSSSTLYDAIVLPDRDTDNITPAFEYMNYGLVGGIGLSYDRYTVEMRYKVGLSPINNLATFNYQNTYRQDFSTNTLFVSLGIKLN